MNKPLINCIIVDDEMASQKVIEHFIKETEVLKHCRSFTNPDEAFKYLQLNDGIDLIFLDINMPEQNGLNFYRKLNPRPPVIFTTAYPQYAVEGFEVNAIDYLIKPIPYERFLVAIKKLLSQRTTQTHTKPHLFLKENKVIHKVNFEDVIYLEASGDYVKVVCKDGQLLTHSTFNRFLKDLPSQFLRIHKSFCINTNYMKKLNGNQIEIAQFMLPIGQTYKTKVLNSIVH